MFELYLPQLLLCNIDKHKRRKKMVMSLCSLVQREVWHTLLYSGALLDCHIQLSVASSVDVCVELWLR